MNAITPILPGPVAEADPLPIPAQAGTAPACPPPAASLAEVHAFLNAPVVVSRSQGPAGFFPLPTPVQGPAGANPGPASASSSSGRHLPDGISPLGRAAASGDLELVRVLLGARCNPNWLERGNAHGYTPLIAAAENGHVDIAEALLEAGADANLKGSFGGRTALGAAAQSGHLPVVMLLLRQANVRMNEASTNRETPFEQAVANGHVAVAEALMDVVEVPPALATKLVISACRDGRPDIVDLLRRRGRIGNDAVMSRSCLQAAASSGRDNVVAYLLKEGAAVGMSDKECASLIANACYGKCIAVVDRLLSDPDIRSGEVALCYFAVIAADLPLLAHLINRGASPDMQHQPDGLNALMLAVMEGRTDMLEMLLARPGLKLDLASRAERTALEYAMSCDRGDAAMRLLKAGAKVRLASDYLSHTCLLRWAVGRRDGSLFKLVLEQHDLDSAHGIRMIKAALADAVQKRCVHIVEYLLAVAPAGYAVDSLIGSLHRASSGSGHAAAIERVLVAQMQLAKDMGAGDADAARHRYHGDVQMLEHYVDTSVIIDLQLVCKPGPDSWWVVASPNTGSTRVATLQCFHQLVAPLLSGWHVGPDERECLLRHLHAQRLSSAVALPLSDCLGGSGRGLMVLASAGHGVNAQHRAIYYAAALSALDPLAQAARAGRLFASANISADSIARLSRAARTQFMDLHALGDQSSALLGEEMLEKMLPACLQQTDFRYQVNAAGLHKALVLTGLMQPLAQVVVQCWEDSVRALMATPLPVPAGATFSDMTKLMDQAMRQLGQSHFAARLLNGLRQASVLKALRELTSKAETDEALPMLFQIQSDQLRQYCAQLQQS